MLALHNVVLVAWVAFMNDARRDLTTTREGGVERNELG